MRYVIADPLGHHDGDHDWHQKGNVVRNLHLFKNSNKMIVSIIRPVEFIFFLFSMIYARTRWPTFLHSCSTVVADNEKPIGADDASFVVASQCSVRRLGIILSKSRSHATTLSA